MTKKINLRGIKGVPPPPPKTVIWRLVPYFSKNIFQKTFFKKIQKDYAGHYLNTFSETNRLQLILFLASKKFLTFQGMSRLFDKQRFAKTRPKLELRELSYKQIEPKKTKK